MATALDRGTLRCQAQKGRQEGGKKEEVQREREREERRGVECRSEGEGGRGGAVQTLVFRPAFQPAEQIDYHTVPVLGIGAQHHGRSLYLVLG